MDVEQRRPMELGSDRGKVAGAALVSKRGARRGNFAFLAVVVFIAAVMVLGAALSAMSNISEDLKNGPAVRTMFLAHSPILIESEAALTSANGVTSGSGTESDPFVIEGWNVDASTSADGGILISNITSHLVIRDVFVHTGTTGFGIALANLSDVVVEGCHVVNNSVGIAVLQGTNITLENNVADGAGLADSVGIFVMDSTNVSIAENIAVNNSGLGIADMNSTGVSIQGNTVAYSAVAGIAVEMASVTEVRDNIVRANDIGIFLILSNLSYISENVVTNSTTYGVMMMSSANNTLYSNVIAGTSAGEGATLMLCDDNLIYHNDFIDNGAVPQASDLSTTNDWNASYPEGGNYWSDQTSPDDFSGPAQNITGSDGIVDNPYILGGLAQDNYPLVDPVVVGEDPHASFVYTPATAAQPATFNFDATLCWDPDDSPGSLEVRWDWESDGTWDTGWSAEKSAQHVYGLAGSYNVTMEVRDVTGHTDNYTEYLEVEPLAIPELSGLVVPIVSFVAMFLVLGTALRRK